MHLQAVTFAFTAERPLTWASVCWLGHDAKERALLQGIVKASVKRLDAGGGFHEQQTGLRKWWGASGRHRKAIRNPIPKGHIAVLVEGFAEKE